MKIVVIVDSGTSVNILDKNDYKRIAKQNRRIRLQKTTTRIYAYGASKPLPLQTTLETAAEKITETFYVVKGSYGSLLSHDTSVDLGLISVIQLVDTVAPQDCLSQLLENYADILASSKIFSSRYMWIHQCNVLPNRHDAYLFISGNKWNESLTTSKNRVLSRPSKDQRHGFRQW